MNQIRNQIMNQIMNQIRNQIMNQIINLIRNEIMNQIIIENKHRNRHQIADLFFVEECPYIHTTHSHTANFCNEKKGSNTGPATTVRNCIIFSVFNICVVSGRMSLCLGRLNCRFSTGIYIENPGRKRQIECSALI